MSAVLQQLRRVSEAPLAHVEPLRLSAPNQIFRVERRVPGSNVEVAEDEVRNVALH